MRKFKMYLPGSQAAFAWRRLNELGCRSNLRPKFLKSKHYTIWTFNRQAYCIEGPFTPSYDRYGDGYPTLSLVDLFLKKHRVFRK